MRGKCAGPADAGLFLEPGDQVDGVEVAAAGASAHHAGGNGDSQMGLARAGAADQHDVALPRQERSCLQRTHQPLVDRRAAEHERVDVLYNWQLGSAHPVADRGGMAVGGFSTKQIGQDLHGRALTLHAGGDRLIERSGHALEAQPTHGIDHLMPLHRDLASDRSGRSRQPVDASGQGSVA